MANQLGCFGIPKFNVSILASSQEQTGMRDCGYLGDTSFTQIIHLKLDSKTKSPYVSLFFIIKEASIPKWAFGMYHSIPFGFCPPNWRPTPVCMSILEGRLLFMLCLLVLPVAMYRKSWSPTSPFLPPVTIRGEIEPLPMSLSKTAMERAPPSQSHAHTGLVPV